MFTVTRDKIPVYTVDAAYMIDNTTGYIRINSFGATTNAEFTKAASSLLSQGMKDIIIDLQGNGGGYLQASVDLADEFLNSNEMIVYTEGRTTGRHEYHAKSGKINIGKIVVLVDGYTASAAEILSGAMQDNDRGIIIGRRTFGKGLVQRPINLPDGSLIRLTIAHYYSPVGRCFQKPYVKGQGEEYQLDLLNRFNSDISTVSGNAINWLPSIIIAVYRFVATFLVILHYDWVMALIALGSAPFLLLISRFLIKKQRQYSKKVKEMSSQLMSFEVETFYNFDTIKSFGIAPYYSKKLRWWQSKFKDVSLDFPSNPISSCP